MTGQACRVIIVEGLIGAGKTTFARELGEALGPRTLTLLEPDEKGNANPYLSLYYQNAARWSYTMQTHLLARRYRMHQHAQWHALQGCGDAILDRSYQGDTAFAHLQRQLGLMTEDEFNSYALLYHAMTASVLKPAVCIRLLASPECCAQRITRRMELETGRRCESAIDLGYLEALDREISAMVDILAGQGVRVIALPWDEDRRTGEARSEEIRMVVNMLRSVPVVAEFHEFHRRIV